MTQSTKRFWSLGAVALAVAALAISTCMAAPEAKPTKKPAKKKPAPKPIIDPLNPPMFWSPKLIIPEVKPKDKIGFILYTVSKKTLKLTAHLYPLKKGESRAIKLEAKIGGKWNTVATTTIRDNDYKAKDQTRAWNALFRVEKWDTTKDIPVRVVALEGVAEYEGLIRKDPISKTEVTVAAFTGNSNSYRGPRHDIVKNVLAQKVDLDRKSVV